jgi:hypothetical protein
MLNRIFGQRRNGVKGGYRGLSNEEAHKLYSPPSIIRIVKSRRMRWARHTTRKGRRIHMGYWCKIQKENTTWRNKK